jgi:hypothetical protein
MLEAAENDLRNRIVLVVEDEPLIAMYVAWKLEQRGVKIVGPLTSAPQALEVVQQEGSGAVLDAAVLDPDLHSART